LAKSDDFVHPPVWVDLSQQTLSGDTVEYQPVQYWYDTGEKNSPEQGRQKSADKAVSFFDHGVGFAWFILPGLSCLVF
jgi:hypothetical protein